MFLVARNQLQKAVSMISAKVPNPNSNSFRAPPSRESAPLTPQRLEILRKNFPFGLSLADQAMKDSLRPAGKKRQIISCVLCLLFAASILFVAVLMWRNVFGTAPTDSDFALPWVAPATLTGVAILLAFLAWRFLRGDVPSTEMTGRTSWILQLCGIVWLLVTIFILAVSDDLMSTFSLLGMFVGIPCSLALIFLPGYLRLSRSKSLND